MNRQCWRRSATMWRVASTALTLTVLITANGAGTARAVGQGASAAITRYPWMVGVIKNDRTLCGGALISPTVVLTAARCVADAGGGRSNAVAVAYVGESGSPVYRGQVSGINVSRVVVHPAYRADTCSSDAQSTTQTVACDYDVAILQLTREASPQYLRLNTGDVSGLTAVITGWGQTFDGVWPAVLQQASVSIWNRGTCATIYGDRLLCTGSAVGSSTPGPCYADSGAPLAVRRDDGNWYLAGVVSQPGCGLVSLYSDVAQYAPWISGVVQQIQRGDQAGRPSTEYQATRAGNRESGYNPYSEYPYDTMYGGYRRYSSTSPMQYGGAPYRAPVHYDSYSGYTAVSYGGAVPRPGVALSPR